MKTIDDAKADKNKMTDQIFEAIKAFEAVYGSDSVESLRIIRHNGSTDSWGRVVGVEAHVRVC